MAAELRDEDLRLIAHHRFKEIERRQMIADLELSPGDRVLDLGCGIGLWSGWMAERVAPDGRVVGVDVKPASIHVARERLRSCPNTDLLEYVVGDAHAIPLETGSFDVLFCANTLEYFTDPCWCLREMKRVVREGGKVAVKDIDAGHMVLYPLAPELMAQIVLAMTKLVQHRCSNLDKSAGRVLDFFPGRKLHSYFQKAGFHQLQTRSYVIERTQPLDAAARQHLKGLGEFWLSELQPFLPTECLARLGTLFDEGAEDYILSQPDLYYFDAETMTVGIA